MKKQERVFLISVITWILFSILWILAAIDTLKIIFKNIFESPEEWVISWTILWVTVSGAYLLYAIYKILEKMSTEKKENGQ